VKNEPKVVRALFDKLTNAERWGFKPEGLAHAPKDRGVYVIYDPKRQVVHVGRTRKAKGGIRQRLRDHLHNRSSFTVQWLHGDGEALVRKKYRFQSLNVRSPRRRALLEAYATGRLCPKHIGVQDDT
jgi:excinuclease UvrABC nuclease subunit